MITRYDIKEISDIWSDKNKFETWLKVEVAASEAWHYEGTVPKDDIDKIKSNAKVDSDKVIEYINITHHDVTAFIKNVNESLGDEQRWIHYGLTSQDVWDTSTNLQIIEAINFLETQIRTLKDVIYQTAIKHKMTPCIGRTHGIHAEPTTFGLKLLVWVESLNRQLERISLAKKQISVGQFSGPVGTHATVPPSVEQKACELLGLDVAKVTTQVIQRDRHAFVLEVLANIGSSLESFATELRHLQRTEVREIQEPFATGQTGSSSMPHKRNPELCERITGLARVLRGYSNTALENVALWHERDISHSGAERIIFPDSTGLLAYMLQIFTGVMKDLIVFPEQMKKNIDHTKGLIFSSKVMLILVEKGLSREEAYNIVQRYSAQVIDQDKNFRSLLDSDDEIANLVSKKELDNIFDINQYLIHVEETFNRVK
ncbi:MAG: adenylosuccinate lyase [Chloroflexi bacterium]|jgi:adenylosuccinate lyase|nr:MAG: adenylosuccinate lyase [Chloroflexota bacterium]|tara:strand:- start:254 stop:1543 length:1290 start_codon:yes stop_codon:yes gene_type:complete